MQIKRIKFPKFPYRIITNELYDNMEGGLKLMRERLLHWQSKANRLEQELKDEVRENTISKVETLESDLENRVQVVLYIPKSLITKAATSETKKAGLILGLMEQIATQIKKYL